jgi:hypothetical protein
MAFPFFTIGHSTRPIGEFIDLLVASEVGLVVDVRTIPRSRTNPHYNRETLPGSLSGFQIAYEHVAELGGRRARAKNIAPEINAFWENQSFHNYADYAMGSGFRSGLARLRELGPVRGGSVVAVPPPDHCVLPARRQRAGVSYSWAEGCCAGEPEETPASMDET